MNHEADWGNSAGSQICGFIEKNRGVGVSHLVPTMATQTKQLHHQHALRYFPSLAFVEGCFPGDFKILLEGRPPLCSDAQQRKSLFDGKQIFGRVHIQPSSHSVLCRQCERLSPFYPPAWLYSTGIGRGLRSCCTTGLSSNIFHSERSLLPRCIYHPSKDCTRGYNK